jgi:hypothetical protein
MSLLELIQDFDKHAGDDSQIGKLEKGNGDDHAPQAHFQIQSA